MMKVEDFKASKSEYIVPFAMKEGDTGSSFVQVSILTKRISYLTEHLKINSRDKHSRRGLLQLVADRARHLKYIHRKYGTEKYRDLIGRLGIKDKIGN